MKAISLWQPWASAIALGVKTIETRSWQTSYRGPLLIHAARKWGKLAQDFAATEKALGRLTLDRVPLGAFVAVCNLVDIEPSQDLELTISPIEKLYGNYQWGRYGWKLEEVRAFDEPIGYRGAQGLFEVPDAVVAEALRRMYPRKAI
jgi:hypothetical protein